MSEETHRTTPPIHFLEYCFVTDWVPANIIHLSQERNDGYKNEANKNKQSADGVSRPSRGERIMNFSNCIALADADERWYLNRPSCSKKNFVSTFSAAVMVLREMKPEKLKWTYVWGYKKHVGNTNIDGAHQLWVPWLLFSVLESTLVFQLPNTTKW